MRPRNLRNLDSWDKKCFYMNLNSRHLDDFSEKFYLLKLSDLELRNSIYWVK